VARFLKDHREAIAAFDFFTVSTLSFRTLYCFFVIEHAKRQVLQFNVTLHPTSEWIVQQLREAFPLPCPYQYVLFDQDGQVRKRGGDLFEGECSQADAYERSQSLAKRHRRTMGGQCTPRNCSTTSFR
jgi:hypothetical protein